MTSIILGQYRDNYNGPLVKTKREKVTVNQEFPNGYDLYCSLSRKK